jgi:hypothetical protein
MPQITITERPKGQRDDYLFVSDGEQTFKALHELRGNDGGQPVVAISLAPVDADGKALRRSDDEPDVIWHSHTFTEAELTAPDFDMDARVGSILDDLAAAKRREMAARAKVTTLGDAWRSGNLRLK